MGRFTFSKIYYLWHFITDAESFEPTEAGKKPVALLDKWEGEDEDEDVKVTG